MGLERYAAVLARTTKGFTQRWSCQRGDYLLWFRRDPLAGLNRESQIMDLWWIPDGAFVTITNRWQDFPDWFQLHPTEVANGLIPWMKMRIEARDYPEEPVDGPNIWRAKGGDRIVWVGPPREGQTRVDGVLGLLSCRSAVAVLGEHPHGPIAFMEFKQTEMAAAFGAAAVRAERSLGLPCVFDTEWLLG